MARNNVTCDICQQACERVVAKLFIAPVKDGETRKTHGDYTAHADVGECCAHRFVGARSIVKWQKRKKIARKAASS